ncbi:hypothetical protein GF376_04285 [Candidatus Peregrinibacteria bacterium]|nr:hypothetical protein [Candidatus Peregrinibacteria bacterium]
MRKIAEIDIDDTLIPWETPHAKAYPAMAEALSKATKIDLDEIIRQIKVVNTEHGTIEYTPLVQSMEAFRNENKQRILELIDIAYQAKNSAVKGLNQPYQGIESLLKKLKNEMECVHARSDAPVYLANKRLKQAKLIQYFNLLFATKSPPDELFPSKYHKGTFAVPYHVVDKPKPHTNMQACTILYRKSISENFFMIGNSCYSDEGFARINGMLFFKTNWDNGTKEDRAILRKFAPEKALSRNIGTDYTESLITATGFEKIEVETPYELIQKLIKMKILTKITE